MSGFAPLTPTYVLKSSISGVPEEIEKTISMIEEYSEQLRREYAEKIWS